MREILFRGKTAGDNEWVYGYLFVDQRGAHYICDTNNDGDSGIDMRRILVKPETVGQYIGQKSYDKDRIFAGDILREVGEDNIGVVEYDEAQYKLNIDSVVFDFGYINSEWYEVIGNIHDNPELLKEQR